MRKRGRRLSVLVPVLCLLWAVCGLPAEDTPKTGILAKVVTEEGCLLVGELKAESPDAIRLLELGTGKELSIKSEEIRRLKRNISVEEAIKWVGLTRYVAWRLVEAQEPSGRVSKITEAFVFVTLGAQDWIEPGSRLKVYHEAERLTDPDTGEVLGALRVEVAELEALEVRKRLTKARVIEITETVPERGDLVEPVRPGSWIALLPITDARGRTTDASSMMLEELTTTLVARGVMLLERSKIHQVLTELERQQTERFSPETASDAGKLLGAWAVLIGTVGIGVDGNAELHVRLVSVKTGEILFAAKGPAPWSDHAGGKPSPAVREKGTIWVRITPETWRAYYRINWRWQRRDRLSCFKVRDGVIELSGVAGKALCWLHGAQIPKRFSARARLYYNKAPGKPGAYIGVRGPGGVVYQVAIPAGRWCTVELKGADGEIVAYLDEQQLDRIESYTDPNPPSPWVLSRLPASHQAELTGQLYIHLRNRDAVLIKELELRISR